MKYQTILLNGTKVEYRIIPKNNKNTYFKFRKNGTIEITKSRYQSKRDIIKFMRQNADQFVHKLSKVKVDPIIKDGHYSYFGQELKIEHHELLKVDVDLENQIIYLPSEEIDPNRLIIRKAERNQLLLETEQLGPGQVGLKDQQFQQMRKLCLVLELHLELMTM